MGAREQGSKGAELNPMTILSNQDLKREQGSNGATEQNYIIWQYFLTQNCKWEQGSKGAREQNYIIWLYDYIMTLIYFNLYILYHDINLL